MEHISDVIPQAFDSWQYYRSRWAFFRRYYPEHAERWIVEDMASVTGRRAVDDVGIFPVTDTRDRSLANAGADAVRDDYLEVM